MALTHDTPTTFTCVDPMGTRWEPKQTETAGTIVGTPDNGYFTTHREEVAKELQEKYPHMLVTRHETPHRGKATRLVWSVPELPWKKKEREAQEKSEHGE